MTNDKDVKKLTRDYIKSKMLELAEVDGNVSDEDLKQIDYVYSSLEENANITSTEVIDLLSSLSAVDGEKLHEESELVKKFIQKLSSSDELETSKISDEITEQSLGSGIQNEESEEDAEPSENEVKTTESPKSGMIREEDIPPSTENLDIDGDAHMWIRNLDLFYGSAQAIYDVSIPIEKNSVTALIGPSGCGKSTLLRCLNRMNDLIPSCKIKGEIEFDGENISGKGADLVSIRRRVGMVFQKPNPFPKSIYDNIAYGVRLHYTPTRRELDRIVEKALTRAAIWDEVNDRLHELGTSLSGGQQQRICIARTIAVEPDVILMDEPCSALDPIATAKIEELILELKKHFTVVIVTHSMSQAQRVSDYTGFMYLGRLVEFGKTEKIFTDPDQDLTNRYISGRFG